MINNLEIIIQNIENARISFSRKHIVKLVAIGKYTSESNIRKLYSFGQRAFGENQVQQLSNRVITMKDIPIEWHMVGILQKNKINMLIKSKPSLFHSLDSLYLAENLNTRLQDNNIKMNCLIQINSSKDKERYGIPLNQAVDTYLEIIEKYPFIILQGIMSTGSNTDSEKIIQEDFEKVFSIYQKLNKYGANICSMGMSSNYEIAIKCGSNLVRIGSDIFQENIL